MARLSAAWLHLFGLILTGVQSQVIKDREKGALIGKLQSFEHGVEGKVWAADENTIYIEGFKFDGKGPDAFFWVGNQSNQPSPKGFIARYPINSADKKPPGLPRFDGENVLIRLPKGKKITDMNWLSVWSPRFTMDYGSVIIPADLEPPRKKVLSEFTRGVHGVRSGNVVILDAQTFYIPNLHYDGTGPDAFFWVGKGYKPDPLGQKVPNELKSYDLLRKYDGEDIEIQLPGNLSVYDIDYLSIYCVQYKHDFGHVMLPDANDLWVPPSLGQTKIKTGFKNCRLLSDDMKVEWRADKEDVRIRLTGRMDDDQFFLFGLSPEEKRQEILGSDLILAYYDSRYGSYHAIDYTVTTIGECLRNEGLCPDERVHGRNDASVIEGERKNGMTSITFTRPFETNDIRDVSISRGWKPVPIIAGIGRFNSRNEAKLLRETIIPDEILIDFASMNDNLCDTEVDEEISSYYEPWPVEIVTATTNFSVSIGPTGGKRGYEAITGIRKDTGSGSALWDIAFWVNDMLIPEVYVERGQTYYFTVETGNDEFDKYSYHPFYITNSSEGGFYMKTHAERQKERIYAGVKTTDYGNIIPEAVGRLCEWLPSSNRDAWEDSLTFYEYRRTLYKECHEGLPGSLEWYVDQSTPDLVYYQSFMHENMGWKIHVSDAGYNLKREGNISPSLSFSFTVVSILLILQWRTNFFIR